MAVLTEQRRFDLWAQVMRDIRTGAWGTLTKHQIRAGLDAIDAWVDTNAAGFNGALPQPFRAQATSQQKALGLLYVVEYRFLDGV